ncbi:MAG TPA: hypothetical protein VFG04_22480 [Planctomycetaceae bacterium]|nr:hypothetical protein [Planctomycetaceae bacterium]
MAVIGVCARRMRLVVAVAICLVVGRLAAQTERPDYRLPDRRPRLDDDRLRSQGIVATESKRLKLYTDVPLQRVRSIGPGIDALYEALTKYFGPLPPARDGLGFTVTGFLMGEQKRFRDAGLLPADLPTFLNGRHRGQQLWVNEQDTDYFRRHLVLHEFTHCFMYALPEVEIPAWYAEGMAELFGTHQIDDAGDYHFRVMPDRLENFRGHGRISLIRSEVAQNRWKSLEGVEQIGPKEFLQTPAYAWSWAACAFLDGHPRYAKGFRELGRQLVGDKFEPAVQALLTEGGADLKTEWSLFTHELQYGFDLSRAAIQFQPGKPLEGSGASRSFDIAADRGWQSSGVLVRAGVEYELTATGEVTLANAPKPWMSQPQGVSILYSEGHPIGQLLAAIHREPAVAGAEESMLHQIAVGREIHFTAPISGTLYFRINDHWNSLADNSGSYRVTVREAAPR